MPASAILFALLILKLPSPCSRQDQDPIQIIILTFKSMFLGRSTEMTRPFHFSSCASLPSLSHLAQALSFGRRVSS